MKNIIKSKTMIFNAITVLVVVATFFGYETNQELAGNIQAFLLAIVPLINIFLRTKTYEAVN